MAYTPHTDAERRAMLQTIGVADIEDLFAPIPAELRAGPLDLPPALTEAEVMRHLAGLARQNVTTETHASFLGGGAYHHHIPAAVAALAARGEYVTAYTPYQAELSQGTLQVIYEWQSLICTLTGLDVANASLYDAATGCAEAAAMAVNSTQRGSVVVAGTSNPDYLAVLRTYMATQGLSLREAPVREGLTDARQLAALLAPPGEVGADIATGDAQPFGVALQYGGPYVGFLAARESLLRRMPGRIAGASVDRGGHRAYVLTLQTREQHIKRDRATSNICSNHALCATIATIYLAHQGKAGLRDVATLCVQKAHYAAERIAALPGYSLRFSGPFFHEFVVRCPKKVTEINRALLARGILGGIPLAEGPLAHTAGLDLENCMLICVTEVNSKDDIDALVAGLEAAA